MKPDRFPRLLGSATFKEIYERFLPAVVAWGGKHPAYVTPELLRDVRAELSGTYILKPKYAPVVPPPDVPEGSADEPPMWSATFS